MQALRNLIAAPLAALALAGLARAQENLELGKMWLTEEPPLAYLQEEYGFAPDAAWFEHLRLASIRFGSGCSSSFVSPQGLIMTNHHCVRGQIAEVQGENDWVADGFYARALEDEVKIPGLTVQQVVDIRDVTEDVNAGIADTDDDAAKTEKRTANMERIVAAATTPGTKPQVVTLFQGARYHLYTYKIWDDIRLVCAPHLQTAHFGGDYDNFTFPRWCLDFSFVRAYVDGKPADSSEHFFKWKTEGADEGDLVFVTGNPGSTGRLQTLSQCEFLRDHLYPNQLERVHQMLDRMNEQAAQSPEAEKELRSQILRFENTRKAFQGYLDGLRNPRIMEIKAKAEAELRAAVAADADLQAKYGAAWDEMEKLQQGKIEAMGDRAAMREIQTEERKLQTMIGEACFAVYGTSIPPDATMSPRISDGLVKGYAMNGTVAPFYTSLYGLYARHNEFGGDHPFDLPQVWLDKEKDLDMTTPFNFVATCDIIGGNSGSPMIDREANVVGLIFDGNIEMLGNNYVFDDEVSRTVSVHPAIIIESLRKIYDAASLADELEHGRR